MCVCLCVCACNRYAEWRKKAKIAAMDYCFHMAVTGWNDKVAKDMGRLTAEEVMRPLHAS